MHFTLRQLQVFLAVAHNEHLTRAAETLSLSQSATSSALKDLENQFSLTLFDRVGKRLQLNEQGRLLRPKAEALLAQAQELEQSLRQHAQVGPISVGATLSIGNYLAVGLMAKYMAQHPQSTIRLDVANTHQIVQKILNYELDMGLIEGEVSHPDLHIEPWQQDTLVVFCHPNHPLAQRQQLHGRLTDDDLQHANWILRETGSGTRQAFDRAMHGLLPNLHIGLELQHTEAIKRAVEAQLGIGCLSQITLRDAFSSGRLVPLIVPQRDFSRQLYLITHRQKFLSTGLKAWIALCQQSKHDSSPAPATSPKTSPTTSSAQS